MNRTINKIFVELTQKRDKLKGELQAAEQDARRFKEELKEVEEALNLLQKARGNTE